MADNLPAIIKEHGIKPAQWSALSTSIYPGAKPESIVMAWDYCQARGLDPLKKPVHIVPMKVKDASGDEAWRDVIMPGISELRTTAARTGQYAGIDEPVFGSEIDFLGAKVPSSCSVTVYRMVGGQKVSFTNTERFSEACGIKKGWTNGRPDPSNDQLNAMWTKRPYGQLAKCAEAGALRKAFPEELGSAYVPEEVVGGQIIEMGDAEQVESGEADLMPRAQGEPPKAQTEQKGPVQQDDFMKDYEKAEVVQPEQPARQGDGTKPGQSRALVKPNQIKVLNAKLNASGKDPAQVYAHFGIPDFELLPLDQINEALEFLSK